MRRSKQRTSPLSRQVRRTYLLVGLWSLLALVVAGALNILVFVFMKRVPDFVPNKVEGTEYDSFDLSPDGRAIVFAGSGSGGKDLYLLDLDTRRVTRLTDSTDYENYPAFSPDGRSIVYQAAPNLDRPRFLFIRSLDGTHVLQITESPSATADMYPSFSRDGSRVVFTRALFHPGGGGEETIGALDVWAVNRDGTYLRRLTRERYDGFVRPRFSPDGLSIIFERWEDTSGGHGQAHIAVVDSGVGGSARELMRAEGWSTRPTYFLDGHQIAFVSDMGRRFDYDLYRMSLEDMRPVALRVNRYGTGFHDPAVAPDGHSIFYQSGYGAALWQVNADGSNPHLVAGDTLFSDPLHWKP